MQVLIWGTTVLAVLAIFAIWANRQILNPDNWASTSTQLLQNGEIREATSNYLVDQLYANVNVEQELKAKLPTQLAPLAGPLAGALHNLANEAAQRALASPRVQEVWKHANRAADQSFVTIVNGGKGAVAITGGEVTLNLAAIVTNITNRLGLPNVGLQAAPLGREAEDPQVQPAQVRPGRRQGAEGAGAAADDHRAAALRARDRARPRIPPPHADDGGDRDHRSPACSCSSRATSSSRR